MVFFSKYLCEDVKGNLPVIAPQMLTINDLFYMVSGLRSSDRVRLLMELYECYKVLNDKAETLDEFVFWGDVILADFNDVDKYLVDASQLFTNIADYKSIQDTFEYLTSDQKKAIEAFISHFNDKSGRLTVDLDSENPNVKGRFLQIWNILFPLYVSFRDSLRSKGLAYEGMVYRDLADRLKAESGSLGRQCEAAGSSVKQYISGIVCEEDSLLALDVKKAKEGLLPMAELMELKAKLAAQDQEKGDSSGENGEK